MSSRRLALCVPGLLALSALRLIAQTNTFDETGYKPYGSYAGSGIDQISFVNGQLQLTIPLLSYPQRGGKLHLAFNIQYVNSAYTENKTCPPRVACAYYWFADMGMPSSYVQSDLYMFASASSVYNASGQYFGMTASVTTADLYAHQMGNVNGTENLSPNSAGQVWEATDGSGIRYEVDTENSAGVVIDRDGTRYPQPPGGSPGSVAAEDPNGNQVLFNSGSWTDTLGRVIPAPTPTADHSGCTGPLPIASATSWQVPAPSGTATYKLCYATVALNLQLSCPTQGNSNPGCSIPTSTNALQSIVLPGGQAWTFQYDNGGWGDLTKIIFPTGGSVTQIMHRLRPELVSEPAS